MNNKYKVKTNKKKQMIYGFLCIMALTVGAAIAELT